MSESAANWSWITLPGVAGRRMKTIVAALRERRTTPAGLIALIVLGPAAVAAAVLAGDLLWPLLVHASDAATAALYADFEAVRDNPGRTVELIRVVIAAAIVALPPALGMGAFERAPLAKTLAPIAFYPAWLITALAPALVIHQFAVALDPGATGARLASDFLLVFSAAATSIALFYSLWASRQPERFEIERPDAIQFA